MCVMVCNGLLISIERVNEWMDVYVAVWNQRIAIKIMITITIFYFYFRFQYFCFILLRFVFPP